MVYFCSHSFSFDEAFFIFSMSFVLILDIFHLKIYYIITPGYLENMSSKPTVQRVVCPEIGLPEDMRKRSQNSNRNPSPERPSSSPQKSNKTIGIAKSLGGNFNAIQSVQKNELETKSDFREFFGTLKEYNANAELGTSRRKFAEDRLTQLGAIPLKQQKMPFKVRLRIMEAEAKREKRRRDELQESHEISADYQKLMKKKSSNGKDNKNRDRKNSNKKSRTK